MIDRSEHYWQNFPKDKPFSAFFDVDLFQSHVPRSARILDVGCGYGRIAAQLAERGYTHLSGIDISETLVQRAQNQLPQFHFSVQKSRGQIDFPDQSADAVLLVGVLTCISSDNEQKALIQEIQRVLVPGGLLYISDFLINSDTRNLERYMNFQNSPFPYGVFQLPEGVILRHHAPAYLRTLVKRFMILDWEEKMFTTMNGHSGEGVTILAQI